MLREAAAGGRAELLAEPAAAAAADRSAAGAGLYLRGLPARRAPGSQASRMHWRYAACCCCSTTACRGAHYYHAQRLTGTLRCHFRQRVHDDPYVNVGVQDITAWVDFTRLAEAGDAAGLTVAGFATQAAFLLGTGLETFVGEAAGDRERARLAGEARRLSCPRKWARRSRCWR